MTKEYEESQSTSILAETFRECMYNEGKYQAVTSMIAVLIVGLAMQSPEIRSESVASLNHFIRKMGNEAFEDKDDFNDRLFNDED